MVGKFQLYQDKAGEYRFRLMAGNGENIGLSEGYRSKAAALTGIESVRANSGNEKQYVFKEGKNGKVYFCLKAKNHQVVLNSQGYKSSSNAKSGIKAVMKNAMDAVIIET